MKKIVVPIERLIEFGGMKKEILFLLLSAISLLMSIFKTFPIGLDAAWLAVILCGLPIILEAIIGLVTEFDIKADVLVSIALIASICIGQIFAAGEVAFIMQLGSLLEEATVARARAGIEKLVQLTPQTARLLRSGEERIIPAEQVAVDDLLRVLPGETIPVDGIISKGQTSVNQAVMTGESMPVDKTVGDSVSSGTVNQFGAFEMRVSKVGEDSSIQRMIRLVQSADASKAKIVGIADRWATWIVLIALTAAALTWFFSGEIIRAVTILVVFCPCALVLATPTAIMAAIGNATKHGFLVREGDALERLAKVSKIGFDKTGTLTYGRPEVVAVKSILPEYSDDQLYAMTAAAELNSEHPLGKAIVNCYRKRKGEILPTIEDFAMLPGRGVRARIGEKTLLAGNEKLMVEQKLSLKQSLREQTQEQLAKGATVIYLALDQDLAGYIALSDTLREESTRTIDALRSMQLTPVLLTGDNENAANHIAKRLHITEWRANCLPEDKLKQIESYQSKEQRVCMIGDGINDAPSLKMADVGIAMGGVGSDIAIDAADIALVDDEVKELPHLLALSKRMMTTIKCNMCFSMGLNFLAIILATLGILNPVVGALVHNAGSIIVIMNSALLLCYDAGNRQSLYEDVEL